MASKLTPKQRALADYMSDLSEEAYCAGWMSGLEYALWEAVLGRKGAFGRVLFGPEKVGRLKDLAQGCGGWIIFDETSGKLGCPCLNGSSALPNGRVEVGPGKSDE